MHIPVRGTTTASSPPVHNRIIRNFQNTDAPDIDFDRDLIGPEVESEIALGMEASEIASDRRFRVNISTIIISALIFLAILAWFDFIQTTFYLWLVPEAETDPVPSPVKLWYAILITFIVLILVALIFYYSQNNII